MHFITGGAYNGKSNWVKEHYDLVKHRQYTWISTFDGKLCPTEFSNFTHDIIVLEGIEKWIKKHIQHKTHPLERGEYKEVIQYWLDWEKQTTDRKLIIIGTDMSKGIVPMEQQDREWRDITGWFYQDLVKSCHRFDVIWYGVQKRLK